MITKVKAYRFRNVILSCTLLWFIFIFCKNHSIVNTFVKDKNVFVTDASGLIKQITFKGRDNNPVITQDLKTLYFVRETDNLVISMHYDGYEKQLCIMKFDLENSTEDKICDRVNVSPVWNDSLVEITNLSISLSGNYLFFETPAAYTSGALVKLNPKTKEAIVISGSDKFDLIKEGQFNDKIIVNKSYFDENPGPFEHGYLGRQWSNWLIDFDGKEIKKIGDEKAVLKFLKTYSPTLEIQYKQQYHESLKRDSIQLSRNHKNIAAKTSKNKSSNFHLENSPPIWADDCLRNSTSYFFPFEHQTTFKDAVIYFERKEGFLSFLGLPDNIFMRYRVSTNNYTIEELRMKDTPEMLVKLGDGTILTGIKERVSTILLNAQYFIDVYFTVDNEIQEKILKYGIEKVRIAYVFEYMGLNRNQIFDAYSKDCIESGLTAGMFLQQIKNADIKKAKQDAKKNSLNNDF